MRTTPLFTLLMLGLLCVAPHALADFSTPFIDGPNNKVGDIAEGHGFLMMATPDDGLHYLILVTSDTERNFIIMAEAEKGVVPAQLLGRSALIRAQVLVAPRVPASEMWGMSVKILAVRAPTTRSAPKPTTGPTTRP